MAPRDGKRAENQNMRLGWPLGVRLSVRSESKLGLEPTEHQRSKARGQGAPTRRARLHRQSPKMRP